MVERDLAKVEVAGSSPVIRSKKEKQGQYVLASFYNFILPSQQTTQAEKYMLIEIESFYGNHLLHGKKLKVSEVKAFIKSMGGIDDPVSLFCARFAYEELPYREDIRVDLTIDLDTHRVIVWEY